MTTTDRRSQALLDVFPQATFRGLDIDPFQVKRYNAEAVELVGLDFNHRMLAIQGDLEGFETSRRDTDWTDFDAVVTSVALHHMEDPGACLARLGRMVRPGGSLVVLDFSPLSASARQDDTQDSASGTLRLPHGDIWLGFSSDQMQTWMEAAGCGGFNMLHCYYRPLDDAPKEMAGLEYMFIASGIVQ
jgi:SAM-dependent methyltransferase